MSTEFHISLSGLGAKRNGKFSVAFISSIWIIRSSFLSELFESDHLTLRIFSPALRKLQRWSSFGIIPLTSPQPCCIPWFTLLYAWIAFLFLSCVWPGQDNSVIMDISFLNIKEFKLSGLIVVLMSFIGERK